MIEFAQLIHEAFAISAVVGILLGLLSAMFHTWLINRY